MIMLDSLISFLSQHWLIILPLLFIIYLLKNYLNHGLYKYPGPALASLTDWWRFFDVLGRRPDLTQIKLHQRHGEIVRLGPNALSFASPLALKTIYGLNKGFTKVTRFFTCRMRQSLCRTSQSSIRYSRPCPKALDCQRCSQPPMSSTTQHCVDLSITPSL